MKKSKDVLNSGNPAVEFVIDHAIRTFYPHEGCWRMPSKHHNSHLAQQVWEWASDKQLPSDFVLEQMCSTQNCVNPDCQGVYTREVEGVDSNKIHS